MDLTTRVEEIIRPSVEAMGFDIVRVQLLGQKRFRLQIMIEPLDERSMTVDDCAEVSRAVSALLDVEDPIQGSYTLEVSSPGIDRPLVKPRDFERFAGFEVKVETSRPVDGRRRFKGRLLGLRDDRVTLEMDGEEIGLAFDDVEKAKLLLTDELLAAAEEQQE